VSSPNAKYGLLARGIRRDLTEKGWVPVRYWVMWWGSLGIAVVVFYVVLTPIWLGLRGAAWVAELRSRRRRPRVSDVSPTRPDPAARTSEKVSGRRG
jgi:hypothetical protein